MFLAWRTFPDQTGNEGSAWRTAFLGGYSLERNGIKLLDSSSQYYFYATGVTPAMEARMVGSGSQYALAFVDAAGRPLDVVAATTGSLTLAA